MNPARPETDIAVIFPTATEASQFRDSTVQVMVSGVGLTAAAYATSRLLRESAPDWCILGGIAGAYPHSGLQVGDTVLVASAHEADLGVFTPTGFVPMHAACPELSFPRRGPQECRSRTVLPDAPFRWAHCASVNAAQAPFIDTASVDIEDMEAAAFCFVCLEERQPFLAVRTISNIVGDSAPWDVGSAVTTLTEAVHTLVDYLRRQPRASTDRG